MTPPGAGVGAHGRQGRFDPTAFLFNAAGRSGRTGYLLGIIVGGLLMKSSFLIPAGAPRLAWAVIVGFPGFVIWGVLTSRRLHDLGYAGWWFALLAGLAAFAPGRAGPPQTPVEWATGSVVAALTVVLLLWPGQRRFNRFGPEPAGIA